MAVGQQGNGQLHRQIRCVRAVRARTKAQLVQDDLVAGLQLGICIDAVIHIRRKLASFNAITGVFVAVGRELWQLQITHLATHIQGHRTGQRIDAPIDFQAGRARHPTAQTQWRQRGHTSICRLVRQSAQTARQLGHFGRIIGPNVMVRKRHAAVDHPRGAQLDPRLCSLRLCRIGRGQLDQVLQVQVPGRRDVHTRKEIVQGCF